MPRLHTSVVTLLVVLEIFTSGGTLPYPIVYSICICYLVFSRLHLTHIVHGASGLRQQDPTSVNVSQGISSQL